MKKTILLFSISLLIFSCGKSPEEQMLTDYIGKGMKETINVNIEDTDFEIKSIEKLGEVKATDSLKYYKDKLTTFWIGSDAPQQEKDTLTFTHVMKEVEKTIESQNKLILAYIKADQEYNTYEPKREREKWRGYQKDLIWWNLMNSKYSKNPDKVLSHKYKATHTMTNPVLKVKQTFDKIYYTNSEGTVIIKSEEK